MASKAKRQNRRPTRPKRNQKPPEQHTINHKDLVNAANILRRGDKPSPAEVIIKRTSSHAEAYCLMTYQCESCQVVEELWNSRDGVTPFVINCRECSGEMKHIDWQDDQRRPDYIPKPGQRVFIDMPDSLKEPLVRWRIAQAKGMAFEVRDTDIEQRVRQIVANGFQPGEPWIVEWPV